MLRRACRAQRWADTVRTVWCLVHCCLSAHLTAALQTWVVSGPTGVFCDLLCPNPPYPLLISKGWIYVCRSVELGHLIDCRRGVNFLASMLLGNIGSWWVLLRWFCIEHQEKSFVPSRNSVLSQLLPSVSCCLLSARSGLPRWSQAARGSPEPCALHHREATYAPFPTCLLSCGSVFPLSKSRAVTNCIMRWQVSAEGTSLSTSTCGWGSSWPAQVFCFSVAVVPGAAHSWPGMKSPRNKWDRAHLQRASAPERRRSRVRIFIMLGPSAFTKRSGGVG